MQKIRQIAKENFFIHSFFSSGYHFEIIKMTAENLKRQQSLHAYENSIAYYTMIDYRKIKVLKELKQYPSPMSTLPFDPTHFQTPTYFEGSWIWMTHQPLSIIKMNNNQTIQHFSSTRKITLKTSPWALTRQRKHFQSLLHYLLLKGHLA